MRNLIGLLALAALLAATLVSQVHSNPHMVGCGGGGGGGCKMKMKVKPCFKKEKPSCYKKEKPSCYKKEKSCCSKGKCAMASGPQVAAAEPYRVRGSSYPRDDYHRRPPRPTEIRYVEVPVYRDQPPPPAELNRVGAYNHRYPAVYEPPPTYYAPVAYHQEPPPYPPPPHYARNPYGRR